jgi:hypothetical protein
VSYFCLFFIISFGDSLEVLVKIGGRLLEIEHDVGFKDATIFPKIDG